MDTRKRSRNPKRGGEASTLDGARPSWLRDSHLSGSLLREPEPVRFSFIAEQAAEKAFPIAFMCRMLGVSRQGFYQWRDRPPSQRALHDAALTERIAKIHTAHGRRVGVRRVRDELARAGVTCSHKRTHRLMRAAGLRGAHPRPYKRTTLPGRFDPSLVDLLRRDCAPTASSMPFGWRSSGGNPPPGVIFHSDRGSQYTSDEFRAFCRANGVRPSVGRTGSCFDNAVAESFFATLKKELIHIRPWPTIDKVRTAVFEYIESYYNRRRRHSTIDYDTTIEYELKHALTRLQAA